MEIIPVIDIMGGKVVHASGGDRNLYPALQSIITSSSDPQQVVRDLLAWHPFDTLYIADLDMIENGGDNHVLYRSLVDAFPDVNFWIDAGIKNYEGWLGFRDYSTIYPVIGSETLHDSEWLLSHKVSNMTILSLDFKNGRYLGEQNLLEHSERWTEQLIVMELDNVGERSGPNIEHLLALQKQAVHSQLIAAGGIRNKHDLMRLAEKGIKHALVASALHDGSLSKNDLK
ncbi:MAG: hypothetical protein COA63_002170 [Methylophaga sp.]|nr:hypothetical protein [Methylophaga sp.]